MNNNVRLEAVTKPVAISRQKAGTRFGIQFADKRHGILRVVDPRTKKVELQVTGRHGFTRRSKLEVLQPYAKLNADMGLPGKNGYAGLIIMMLRRVVEVERGKGFPHKATILKHLRSLRPQTRDIL